MAYSVSLIATSLKIFKNAARLLESIDLHQLTPSDVIYNYQNLLN